MLYLLEPTQRQEDCQSPGNIRWDTQLFTRLAWCDKKEEIRSSCLEVEGEPCHQGEGHLADVSQTVSSLSDTTCQARHSPSWVVHAVAFPTLEKRWLQ